MLRHLSLICALVIAIASPPSFASIALNSTRVILENGKNEASFGVRNMGDGILIQSWLDADSSDSSNAVQHFTLTPQLVRVQANSEQVVRILYEGVGAPSDRESMFWLNVQEIPQRVVGDEPIIQLAILQRIKVFYRPKDLAGNLDSAIQNIEWSYRDRSIQITNPSSYHVTVVGLTANNAQIEQALVIPPHQTYTVALSSAHSIGPQTTLMYSSINDFGSYIPHRVVLSGEHPIKGELISN
ncbi:MAG: fimbrial biogenesis chaperone [Paenalcaligenes sp.]